LAEDNNPILAHLTLNPLAVTRGHASGRPSPQGGEGKGEDEPARAELEFGQGFAPTRAGLGCLLYDKNRC